MAHRQRIEKANEASAETLFAQICENKKSEPRLAASLDKDGSLTLKDGRNCQLLVSAAADVSKNDRDDILSIFENNMKSLYEASSTYGGYKPEEKYAELFDETSRFILIRTDNASGTIVGYTMFRFELDDDEKESVIYCYEVQVSSTHLHLSLGSILMSSLHLLCLSNKIPKVLLTVFKRNTGARAFYRRIGYTNDASCPSRYGTPKGEEEPDYEILSRKCMVRGGPPGLRKAKLVGGRRR